MRGMLVLGFGGVELGRWFWFWFSREHISSKVTMASLGLLIEYCGIAGCSG